MQHRQYANQTHAESIQLCPNILLCAYVYVELGDHGIVSTYLQYLPLRGGTEADALCCRNLQATLINGGPRALVWGILIVVAGALAQSASLAEMASAQPIAGAQYVCLEKSRTTPTLTTDIALDLYIRTSQPTTFHHLDARMDNLFCLDLHFGRSCEHHCIYAAKSCRSQLP